MNAPKTPQLYDPDAEILAQRVELGGNYKGDGHGLTLSKRIHNEYGEEFQKNPVDNAGGYAACIKCCGSICQTVCCVCAACNCGPVRQIPTGQMGLLIEFGRLIKKLEPGLHSFNQCSQQIIVVDIRTVILDIPKQQLLTEDNVSVEVDAFVTYKIVIPELAIFKVENYRNLVGFMTQGVMKTIVAERTLSELLVNRNEVEKAITTIIDDKTDSYGIKVLSIETRSINLPANMERAMATVAESKKESEAKVIDAQGSLASAKIFRAAADELKGNPIALQLQYFETLKAIASEKNSTIIVPDGILSAFSK